MSCCPFSPPPTNSRMENKGGIRQTELIIYQAATSDWAGITLKIQKANFFKPFPPQRLPQKYSLFVAENEPFFSFISAFCHIFHFGCPFFFQLGTRAANVESQVTQQQNACIIFLFFFFPTLSGNCNSKSFCIFTTETCLSWRMGLSSGRISYLISLFWGIN